MKWALYQECSDNTKYGINFQREIALKIDYCDTCKNPITFDEGKTVHIVCDKCKNKENSPLYCKKSDLSASKSFKFDIIPYACSHNYDVNTVFTTIKGKAIKDKNWAEFNNLLAPHDIVVGKTYTIEIKEKE